MEKLESHVQFITYLVKASFLSWHNMHCFQIEVAQDRFRLSVIRDLEFNHAVLDHRTLPSAHQVPAHK